jgi:hypothetical protein
MSSLHLTGSRGDDGSLGLALVGELDCAAAAQVEARVAELAAITPALFVPFDLVAADDAVGVPPILHGVGRPGRS